MTFDELKNFLLNFEHSYCENDDQNSIILFKINLEEMQKATENKLENTEELSEFEINKFSIRSFRIKNFTIWEMFFNCMYCNF